MSEYLEVFENTEQLIARDRLCEFALLAEHNLDTPARVVGFASRLGPHTSAFYAECGVLWIEIDGKRWPAFGPGVDCVYRDLGGTAQFTLTVDGKVEFTTTYPAWSQHDTVARICGWPLDEQMDLFAYVASVATDASWQQRVLAKWGKQVRGNAAK